jgi:predicted NBD/HSP70 family sugar kinase
MRLITDPPSWIEFDTIWLETFTKVESMTVLSAESSAFSANRVKIIDEMSARPSSTRPAIPPLLKQLNERTVLEAIRAGAPISRAEISRRAGISKPTVSLALQSLLEAGLVREAVHDPGGPSYGAVFFEPVPDAALVLGLDLGARFLRGAICDLGGAVRARQDVELSDLDVTAALAGVAALRRSLVDAAGVSEGALDGAVVGVPGVVDAHTGLVHMTSVPGLEGLAFGLEAERVLELPVAVENDINLAALGEHWLGVARGVDDFIFLSVGTGLGAGLVLRGELHRGRHGAAGELDLVSAGLAFDIDPCAGALSELSATLAEQDGDTLLVPPYDPPAVFTAARAGDAVARAVVSEEARRIALHLVPVAAVGDVDLVVLGGGIGTNGDLLLEPVRRSLAEWLPFPPRIEVSSLGDAAVLTGALAVGRRAALDNVFVNRRPTPAR